jgi:orotate phosphoribosyltransferase-like protein
MQAWKITPEVEKRIFELRKKKVVWDNISEILKIHKPTLMRWKRKKKFFFPKNMARKRNNPILKAKVKQLEKEGYSQRKISTILNLNRRTISFLSEKNNVKIVNEAKKKGVSPSTLYYQKIYLNGKEPRQAGNIFYNKPKDPQVDFDLYNPSSLMKSQFGQVLIGCLMGDGHIALNYKFSYTHSLNTRVKSKFKYKQIIESIREYVIWKKTILDKYFKSNMIYYKIKEKNKGDRLIYESNQYKFLKKIRDDFYNNNGDKTMNFDYIEYLLPLGLAVWFFDDGGISKSGNMYLCTNGFTRKKIEKLNKLFKKKFGFFIDRIEKDNSSSFNLENSLKFAKTIYPYLPTGYIYKRNRIEKLLEKNNINLKINEIVSSNKLNKEIKKTEKYLKNKKPKKKKYLHEIYSKQIEKLYTEGLTDCDISKKLEISVQPIKNWRKKRNLKSNFEKQGFIYKNLNDKIYELHNKGLFEIQIARKLNISNDTVKNWRIKNNLPSNFDSKYDIKRN